MLYWLSKDVTPSDHGRHAAAFRLGCTVMLAAWVLPVSVVAATRSVRRPLPLVFEENRGQAGPAGQFVARGGDWTLVLDGSSQVIRAASVGRPVRVRWLGADPRSAAAGADPLPARVNYYVGNDPRAWLFGVPTWNAVRYEGLYPGVDAVFYAREGALEYDLRLVSGADPRSVRLAFDGADRLEIEDGALHVRAGGVTLRYGRPLVYQEVRGNRVGVPARWRLLGRRRAGFVVGRHDPRLPVVIDPVLEFGTYLGGAGDDGLIGIGVDGSGNVYIVGTTSSSDFPTLPTATYTASRFGLTFVSKLDPTGSTLLSSVVLGPFGGQLIGEGARSAAVDPAGNVYLTGVTSDGLPTVNAVQSTFGGGISDAFVAKLDAAGALAFSTYLGGSGDDAGTGIAVDGAGRVHVVGYTGSGEAGTTPFPVQNASQSTYGGGGGDAFVAQLDAGGALQYATYLGGEDVEAYAAIATNASGSTWVTGQTSSAAFPTTPDAWRPAASRAPFLRSTDAGATWAPSAAPIREPSVTVLAADPSIATTVYAGTAFGTIYRSTDGGDTWTSLYQTPSSTVGIAALAVDPVTPATVYASTGGGSLIRTRDGGAHWAIANVGLPQMVMTGLIVDPGHPATVYALGAAAAISRTDDGADHWAPVPIPDALGAAGLLAVDPTDSTHLVIASSASVAQSFDRGQTWTLAETFGACGHLFCSTIDTLALDPTDPRIIYVAGSFGFAKTTDGGQHWDRSFGCLSIATRLLIDPLHPETLYAVGTMAGGPPFSVPFVVRSFDGGVSWGPGGVIPALGLSALVLAPGPSPRLYAGFARSSYENFSETFVTRFDTNGTVLFSTYAGTPGNPQHLPLDSDASGNVYLPALSLDPAGMPGPFAAPAPLDPLAVSGLKVDAGGHAHVIGQVGNHAFAAEFDPADPAVAVCSVLAGVGVDTASAMTLNAHSDTYVGLTTNSTDLGVPGAYQRTNAGGLDAYLAKIPAGVGGPITDCPASPTTTTTEPLPSCGPGVTTTTQPCVSCGSGCAGALSSAMCQLRTLRAGPLCTDGTLGARLQSFIRRKLDRAQALLDEAVATAGRKRHRALRSMDRRLVAIQKRARRKLKRHRMSDACEQTIDGAIAMLRQTIAAVD